MGNLLIQTAQGFLPYQLRHNLAHGLICHGILIIILRAIGQILENLLNQRVCIVSIQGRYRHNLIKIVQLPVGIDKNQNLFPLYCIRFVNNKNHRSLRLFKLFRDVALPRSDKGARLHQPENHIHLPKRALRHIDHVFSQLVLRLVNARRIQENDLPLITGIHSLNPVSRSLGLIGSNRNLLSNQPVHQCGFSYIRPANQSGKA